jgi:hypothetical protein
MPAQGSHPVVVPTPRRRKRPFGLYAVLVLLALQGPSLIAAGDHVRYGIGRMVPEGQDAGQVADLLGIPISLIVLVLVVGLYRLRRWAWVGTMIFVGLGLTVGIIQYLRDQPLYGTMLLNVFIVFYLNQRDVQDLFERRHPRELRA